MKKTGVLAVAVALLLLVTPRGAFAQGDEIQVYDGGLAAPRVFNLTWHNNYTPDGIDMPEFPGAITSNKSLNGVPEWAYGVTNWFEAGLYMPLYSRDNNLGWKVDGFKLRTLFAVPDAGDRTFVYGVNFEYSYNARHWDTKRFTSEIRPIIGWHFNQVDLIINPIVDTRWDGIKNLEFVPSTRLAYNPSSRWAVALEEYADYGLVSGFESPSNQAHQIFGVFDYSGAFELEAGVGFGLTDASDPVQFKLIVSRDLNRHPRP
jgi:hypothetical protein